MMKFIVRVMVEYASNQRICEILTVPKSSLQGNAWLMEMLYKVRPSGIADPTHAATHIYTALR